jgi:hypothetical protein
MGLHDILIHSRWQHMHGIDIDFGKDRGGCKGNLTILRR